MKKRMLFMLLAMVVFIGVLGFVKYSQIRQAIAQGSSWAPPPEAVTTTVARHEQWPTTLSAIGTVQAVNGVTVSADQSGIVEKITFESGQEVRAGAVLVRLDTSQERAQLASAEAAQHLSELNFKRVKDLHERNVTSQAEYDRFEAESKQTEARVGEARAMIEKKTIRAPFSGVLGIRQVNLGQYLNGGDPVVSLQSLNPLYVNFSVPQQDLNRLKVGGVVRVSAEGDSVDFPGRITAVNAVVDEATRNVEVQATLDNPTGALKPGMFVESRVVMAEDAPVVAVPASAVNFAPYGNSVFIVEEMSGQDGKKYRGVRQQFVKLGESRGDMVAVVSGLEPGAEVVTSGVFKLRNGAAVEVNNAVRPGESTAPKPEDS